MFELFKMVGRLMVDNSGANKALEETDKKAQGTTTDLGGFIDKLKGWAKAAGAALAGNEIVKGIKAVWNLSSDIAFIGETIDKSSQKFMLSRGAYQEWSYVAKRSGFDINTLGDAVVELSKKIGEGKEESLAVLEELGISAADAMTATPEELFDMVIAGLQGVGNNTRRAYLADQLLGGAAKELNPLLNQSADETKNLREEVYKLGGVMSEELVAQSATFADSQTNLQTAWDGVKYHLAEETLPGMTQIMDGLTEMLTGDFVTGLETAAGGVKDYLDGIGTWLDDWSVRVRTSIDEAIGIPDISSLVFDNPLLNPFAAFVDPYKDQSNYYDQQLPFENAMFYAKYGREQNIFDFFNDLFSGGSGSLFGGQYSSPKMDEILRGYNYFMQSGGTEEDFLTQLEINYGQEMKDQFSEFLQSHQDTIDAATETYSDSMLSASNAWNESEAEISAASDDLASSMKTFSDSLLIAAGNSPGWGTFSRDIGFSHANGLAFVPRDNYPANLHYGEQVLTRQQADEYRQGRSSGGNTTINIQTVSQSPAQTAAAVTRAMELLRWAM